MFRLIQLIITLLIVLSLIRSVVSFVQRLWAGTQARPMQAREPNHTRQSSAHTMLQQDPVCGTYVSVDTSLKRLQDGRVVHFCSPECRDRYVA